MTAAAPERALSAKARRVERKRQTSRDIARILDAHDLTAAQVAAETGASAQHVSAWRDPDAEKNLSLADARAVAHVKARRDLMDLIGGAELVAVRRHASPSAAVDVASAAALLEASTAAVTCALRAIADGTIDPAERREMISKLDTLLVDADSMRTALLAVETPAPSKPLRAVPGGGR